MTRDGRDGHITLSDTAIEWVVKLTSGDASPADAAEFKRWRAQSPEHEVAAREAEALWDSVGSAGDRVRSAKRTLAKARLTRRKLLAGGAMILAGVGLKASGVIGPRIYADYTTAVGERRTITLVDGSSVAMNGYTALSVDYSAARRVITLYEGQATFTVAADPGRPFDVWADGGETRAIGTVFDIDIRPNDTAVTVIEGQVVVFSAAGADHVDVGADQRVRYTRRGAPTRPEYVDASAATAWRRGKLIFNSRPLGDVVAELARHRPGSIIIASSALRRMPVSGIFDITDPDAVLDMIEETLPVTVTRLPLVTILR